MGTILAYAEANRTVVLLILSHILLFITAVVKTMPCPGTPWNRATMYTWMYECLHQQFNIATPKPAAFTSSDTETETPK